MLLPVDIEGLFGQPVEVIVLVGEGDIVAAPNLFFVAFFIINY